MAQRQSARGFKIGYVAPPIGFARQKSDARARFWRQGKSRKICRQRRQRQFIHGMVTFIIPSGSIKNGRPESDGKSQQF